MLLVLLYEELFYICRNTTLSFIKVRNLSARVLVAPQYHGRPHSALDPEPTKRARPVECFLVLLYDELFDIWRNTKLNFKKQLRTPSL